MCQGAQNPETVLIKEDKLGSGGIQYLSCLSVCHETRSFSFFSALILLPFPNAYFYTKQCALTVSCVSQALGQPFLLSRSATLHVPRGCSTCQGCCCQHPSPCCLGIFSVHFFRILIVWASHFLNIFSSLRASFSPSSVLPAL